MHLAEPEGTKNNGTDNTIKKSIRWTFRGSGEERVGRFQPKTKDIISNYSSTEINSPNYHTFNKMHLAEPEGTKNNGTDNTIKKSIRWTFRGSGEERVGRFQPKTK
ncbi:hypothetical protein CDAR_422321 [Caerostris darwini]|uniref:Uncharacterized protein n=1 Tax=Caerostris darwini TaxID=1538125 RepID=A0AAV4WS20_9ARAC|nr:hypothetical protein CDAR_422321 [Caerostris darwini]